MSYRERREAKAARLREWADKREAKADARRASVDALAGQIPLGQPILVGHHSEGRARRDQDRIQNGMRRSIEDSKKAADFRRRADGIEAAADHAIYRDDDDAIEKLRERIEERVAERDRIKAYNASCRRGEPDLSLLDDAQRANLMSIAKNASYQLRDGGQFPAYASSNLSGSINKDRKRLAAMEAAERETRV